MTKIGGLAKDFTDLPEKKALDQALKDDPVVAARVKVFDEIITVLPLLITRFLVQTLPPKHKELYEAFQAAVVKKIKERQRSNEET